MNTAAYPSASPHWWRSPLAVSEDLNTLHVVGDSTTGKWRSPLAVSEDLNTMSVTALSPPGGGGARRSR